MPPHSSPGLPHVSAHWLIVVCLFFGHFHDPGVLGASLRPPGAAAPPRPTKSETAISVVFAPDGDAWQWIPMVTRTDSHGGARTRSPGPPGAVGGPVDLRLRNRNFAPPLQKGIA